MGLGVSVHYFRLPTLLLGLALPIPTDCDLVLSTDQYFVGDIAGLKALMCLHVTADGIL